MSEQAKRFNANKNMVDLVPPSLIEEVAKILTFGAKKYDAHNWRKGMDWSKCIASLERHILAFKKGIDRDDESGELHLAHAACNIAFLIEYYKIYPQGDNRVHMLTKVPRIGLDIDDVCAHFVPEYCKRHGVDIPCTWQMDYKMHDNLAALNEDRDFYLNLESCFDPKEINFEPIVYITARNEKVADYTYEWIEKMGMPKAPVIFTRDKGKVCQEYKLDLFVDDSLKNFAEINAAGTACFLMDRTWNRYKDVGYRRITHLNELPC